MGKPTFYEFFAGGGMARAGLGDGWTCLFANDFDSKKRDAYVANWGAGVFHLGDIHALTAADLPGRADLAWGSFPCQDLSLAGVGKGLAGERSGAFWGFWKLIEGLKAKRRAPRLLVLENVIGLLTSKGGADFAEVCGALASLGYRVGALTIDAAHFVPQSRPRLFIVCLQKSVATPSGLTGGGPVEPWHSKALVRAAQALPEAARKAWVWWNLPATPLSNIRFADLIEEAPADVKWHTPAETKRLVSMMSGANLAKLKQAKAAGSRMVGAIYRRTRLDENGEKVQRAEVRFDGVAGCLRTPGGGSSRQFIMVVDGRKVRTRLLSGREAARLMGLADDYRLPPNYNEAYHLLGDGLAVAAVRFLEESLLRKLVGPADAMLAAE